MAGNNYDSNFTRQLAPITLESFENSRVLSKSVDTQLLSGRFNPSSGTVVDFSRPLDFTSKRTPDGDVSALPHSEIITGKASGTVQDMITVDVEFNRVDEALKMGNVDTLLKGVTKRIVTDLELSFGEFMSKNTGLLAGTVGTPVTAWGGIAAAGALMESSGIPMDGDWYYGCNPYTKTSLASDQRSLGAGGSAGGLISEAHRKAIMTEDFAGMMVQSANTLPSLTTSSIAGRVGAFAAPPVVTYLNAKDTMTQVWSLSGFGANLVIKAGEQLEITGRNRLNLSTRKPIIDAAGAPVAFTATVTQDVTLDGAGAGGVVVTGPAIFEATGGYNTVDSAPIGGDVVTLLGAASKLLQSNLFWHKQAFSIGSVPIPKLYATDTLVTTEDGLQMRISKFSDGLANKQMVRFDLHPAFAALNPFFAGQGWG